MHIRFFTIVFYLILMNSNLESLAQEPIAQQTDFNIALVSNRQIDFGEANDQYRRYSDVWGYVSPDSIEYAIIGTGIGTAIYDLSNPENPVLASLIPASLSRWRDYKSYGEYIFGVADEGADGLLIVNMTNAPDSISWQYWHPTLTIGNEATQTLDKCHNLYIDSTFVFLAGCNLNAGGIIIFDLSKDPESPELVGVADQKYAHDVYVQNSTMYTSDLSSGFAIVDINDISQPVTLAVQETSFDFTHNAWASDDGTLLFTTDERVGAMVDAYDISNPDEIILLDQYRPTATLRNGVIPHNVHYYNGYLVISYYIDGVKIVDAHDPTNLVEVGSFDTYFFRDDGFHGDWGAYPYLPSGLLLVSDIESGLYVLRPDYQRAAYLVGQVTDASNSSPLSDVKINIDSEKPGFGTSDSAGNYKMGWAGTGQVDITFQKRGYHPKKLNIGLEQTSNTTLNIDLEPLERYSITGQVVEQETGLPVNGAEVIIFDDQYEERTVSGPDGSFQLTSYEGKLILAAGSWGYVHSFEEVDLSGNRSGLLLALTKGYRDDFIFDYGWTVRNSVNNPTSQGWQRGNPRYAVYNAELTNPNGDLLNDLGKECYVTGLAGNLGANLADTSTLTSPLFDLTNYTDPYLNYFTWFYDFGVFDSDDSLRIYIGNGESEVLVESFDNSMSGWRTQSQIRILDHIDLTDAMYCKYVVADVGNIHICEAAIDAFSISEGETTRVNDLIKDVPLNVFPNPANSWINVDIPENTSGEIFIYDIEGKIMLQKSIAINLKIDINQLSPGIYIIKYISNGNLRAVNKFIKK